MMCQCPDQSVDHEPGQCGNRCEQYVRDTRNGAELHVCWDCVRSHHQRLDQEDS